MWRRWKLIFSLRALRQKVAPSTARKRRSQRRPDAAEVAVAAATAAATASSARNRRRSRRRTAAADDAASATYSMLDHSAARHKMAVRPPGQRRRKRRRTGGNSNNNNNSNSNSTQRRRGDSLDRCSQCKEDHGDNGDRPITRPESLPSEEEQILLEKVAVYRKDCTYYSSGGDLALNRSRSLAVRKSEFVEKEEERRSSLTPCANVVRRHSSAEQDAERFAFKRIQRDQKTDSASSSSANNSDSNLPKREEGDGDSGGGCGDDDEEDVKDLPRSSDVSLSPLEFKSTLNSNVIFRRASPSSLSCKTRTVRSDSSASTGCSRNNRTNRGRERFLTSIEHWTLANEGLRKSICDLSGVSRVLTAGEDGGNAAATRGCGLIMSERAWSGKDEDEDEDDSLDSICSSSFGLEVSR